MEDFSMHVLDVVENSLNAGASRIQIWLQEDKASDTLTLEIIDNGSGMEEDLLRKVTSPFATTRTTRKIGMGLSFLAQTAETAGGEFKIKSDPGIGTRVTATLRLSHIDRMPIGNICETIMTLVICHPDVHFYISYEKDGGDFCIDTNLIREQLEGINPSHPEVIGALRSMIRKGLDQIGVATPAKLEVSNKS